MGDSADHVSHEVTGRYTRVKRLITSIYNCKDPGIQAVISTINNHANNLHDDMTGACLLLLPAFPIAKRLNEKRNNAQISGVGGSILRKGASKTGAEYLYHKPDE